MRRDDRHAIVDLYNHYDGDNEKHKRLQTAWAQLKILSYKNDLTYQTFSSKIKHCFNVIERCDPPVVSTNSQVDMMLSATVPPKSNRIA